MQTDPVLEWRRLTEHYRALRDEELHLLAFDFRDLTEMAQQALRAELHSRRLGDPETIAQPAPMPASASVRSLPSQQSEETQAPQNSGGAENDGPHEYTWKTLLCECDTREQAWQLSRALERAGLESWIAGPGRYSPVGDLDSINPRVLVAADQLDQARVIASQPIPQDIIDESHQPPPADFSPPACPGCGAADPTLESVDPVNAWHCESCGRDWLDTTGIDPPDSAATPANSPVATVFGIRKA